MGAIYSGPADEVFREAARRIREFAREFKGGYTQGLRVALEEIKTDVVASRPGAGVPRDTGALASTIGVEAEGERGEIYAGGPAAPYALVQHERLDYRHPVGEARYLVAAVERWRPDGSAAPQALREMAEAAARKVAR